jgi:hypothetical protein
MSGHGQSYPSGHASDRAEPTQPAAALAPPPTFRTHEDAAAFMNRATGQLWLVSWARATDRFIAYPVGISGISTVITTTYVEMAQRIVDIERQYLTGIVSVGLLVLIPPPPPASPRVDGAQYLQHDAYPRT